MQTVVERHRIRDSLTDGSVLGETGSGGGGVRRGLGSSRLLAWQGAGLD